MGALNSNNFKPTLRTKLTFILLITGVFFSVSVAGAFHFYLKVIARNVLDSWLQAESVSIQEGNLLSSLSNNRRVVLSSQLVQSVALVDDTSSQYKQEILAQFGNINHQELIKGPPIAGQIEIKSLSLFHVHALYRFPETKSLFVVFSLNPAIFIWTYISLNLILFSILTVSAITIFTIARKEALSRLAIIKSSIEELVHRDNPTENLISECPGLAITWKDLKNEVSTLAARVEKESKNSAISQMTQMLAHDVRAPFSSTKILLETLGRLESPAEIGEFIAIAVPEINRSITSVEGLINDVMEISSNSPPKTEQIEISQSLYQSLYDAFWLYPKSEVQLKYDVKHTTKIEADKNKLSRVLSNIINNGLQAMKFRGMFKISTRNISEGERSFVEINISNDGPHIPEENLDRIFDSFFTSGKKGGTGLGLAIADKIVKDHGGKIYCRSEKNEGVSFIFTFPASSAAASIEENQLLEKSSDFINKFSRRFPNKTKLNA